MEAVLGDVKIRVFGTHQDRLKNFKKGEESKEIYIVTSAEIVICLPFWNHLLSKRKELKLNEKWFGRLKKERMNKKDREKERDEKKNGRKKDRQKEKNKNWERKNHWNR